MSRTAKPTITTFAEAEAFFAAHITRSRTYRGSVRVVVVENNTILRKTHDKDMGDGYAVRLHDTDVVTFYADGTVWIEADGWASVTTADRMSRYSPQGVRVSYRWAGGDHRLIVTRDHIEIGVIRSRDDYVLV